MRSRLIEAARPLMAQGRRATVEDILREAGVSRATFYRHFRSRAELLKELSIEPDQGASDRVLDAALDLIGRYGLANLSMEELASTAAVSRATVYRLFPGKPALFRQLLLRFSPALPVASTIERMKDDPPELVMPELARTVERVVRGRTGVIRAVFLEVTGPNPDAGEAMEVVLGTTLLPVASYLHEQMRLGRLRQASPLLALQSFVGPIILHLLTRDLAEARLGLDIPAGEAVAELARNWLRGMASDAS